jgi:hypothetical protein
MLMSASSATANPAPTATPLMAEMIGLSQLIMLWTMSRASLIVCATTSRLPMDFSTTSKSPPAENARPAPVITATRTSSSSARSSHTRLSSLCKRKLVELSDSGRLIVSRAMPSFFSISRCWYEL